MLTWQLGFKTPKWQKILSLQNTSSEIIKMNEKFSKTFIVDTPGYRDAKI